MFRKKYVGSHRAPESESTSFLNQRRVTTILSRPSRLLAVGSALSLSAFLGSPLVLPAQSHQSFSPVIESLQQSLVMDDLPEPKPEPSLTPTEDPDGDSQ